MTSKPLNEEQMEEIKAALKAVIEANNKITDIHVGLGEAAVRLHDLLEKMKK